MARASRHQASVRETPPPPDPMSAKVEATALAEDAEIVGGALIGENCNYGTYINGTFVASAEGLACQAAIDAAASAPPPPPPAE